MEVPGLGAPGGLLLRVAIDRFVAVPRAAPVNCVA